MDTAALRIQGLRPAALKAEIEKRYQDKTYRTPNKPGLSYMIAPVMRTWMLPDWQVHTMPMQHLMFYGANLTNEDIGSTSKSFPLYPFVFKEGIVEQSYIIQMLGEEERARIMTDEKPLLDELCQYRDVLCVPNVKHLPCRGQYAYHVPCVSDRRIRPLRGNHGTRGPACNFLGPPVFHGREFRRH